MSVDNSILSVNGGNLVTNPSGLNSLTSNYNGSDSSKLLVTNATLDANHSWILGNLSGSAILTSDNSTVPNEIYLNGQNTLSITGEKAVHGIWLILSSGTAGTLQLPKMFPTFYNWSVGKSTGLTWTGTLPLPIHSLELAFEFPRRLQLDGYWRQLRREGSDNGRLFGSAGHAGGPVVLSQLPLGVVGSGTPYSLPFPWSSQPQLILNNVNLGAIAWQIYVGTVTAQSAIPVNVELSDSPINELGVTAGFVQMSNCNLQWAVLAALSSEATINVVGSDIWSQTIMSVSGGTIVMGSSNIHGSLLEAAAGGNIEVSNDSTLWPDGNTPTCNTTSYANMMSDSGRALCSPYTNAMQLPTRDLVDASSVIEVVGPANKACLALTSGVYTSAIEIEANLNPALGSATGQVSCTNTSTSKVYKSSFTSYPFQLYRDQTSLSQIVAGATFNCTITVGSASNSFQIASPTCVYP